MLGSTEAGVAAGSSAAAAAEVEGPAPSSSASSAGRGQVGWGEVCRIVRVQLAAATHQQQQLAILKAPPIPNAGSHGLAAQADSKSVLLAHPAAPLPWLQFSSPSAAPSWPSASPPPAPCAPQPLPRLQGQAVYQACGRAGWG